mmetsp:Transcript_10186/g.17740  ORF Transcript_10186/g.17740 Transcript_10186/m.17740 type:complete len:411 (+) Transcript_10186:55-1287(+)
MLVARANGRALPPRPSLLTGDDAACEAAWAVLQPMAALLLTSLPACRTTGELELLEAQPSLSARPELQRHRATVTALTSLVPRLRSLREGLLSNWTEEADTDLPYHVYEVSCDVAAACGAPAAAELLKALQGVATSISSLQQASPHTQGGGVHHEIASLLTVQGALQLQDDQQDETIVHLQHVKLDGKPTGCAPQRKAHPTISTSTSTSGIPPSVLGGSLPQSTGTPCANAVGQSAGREQRGEGVRHSDRRPELLAAHLLFFAVTPARPSPGELSAILGSAQLQPHWHTPVMQWTVQVVAAVSRGDTCAVLRLRQQNHSRLLREVMDMHLSKLRQMQLCALASAYRTLPVTVCSEWLCLNAETASDLMFGVLQMAAGRSPGVSTAWAHLQRAVACGTSLGDISRHELCFK